MGGIRLFAGLTGITLILGPLAGLSFGQAAPAATDQSQPAPAQAPAPTPPATAWSYQGFNFTGWMDAYYSNKFDSTTNFTQLQAFNLTADKISMNSLTGSFSVDPAPIGFKIDLGYGRTYDGFYISEPKHTDVMRYLINAYVSVKPAAWKGLQVDFGKFTTSAGAEVTETHLNWNYSRSLLFAYGPFYHFGVRAAAPVKPNWTLGAQLVQGWNVIDDNNSGKTIGITSVNTFSKVTIANNYYTGPENSGSTSGWRNFYDLAATMSLHSKVSAYVNFDIGKNNSIDGVGSTFLGMAGAARFALTDRFAISPRLEFYNDKDGFMTGVAQNIKEFTLTGEVKLNESFITRLEYRKDWSDQPYFIRDPASDARFKNQQLFMVGLMIVAKPGMFNFGGGKTK